jgi:hypothetical protein
VYQSLAAQNHNTVIPAHYLYWQEIDHFVHQDTVRKNQCLIHLWSSNIDRVFDHAFRKNQLDFPADSATTKMNFENNIKQQLKNSKYHIHIDIEQVWQDWTYLKDQLNFLGIVLNRKHYDYYLNLIKNI